MDLFHVACARQIPSCRFPTFDGRQDALARLAAFGIAILDLPSMAAPRCAEAYASYLENRRRQAAPLVPKSPLPDFFIGAHASILNLPLATADLGRYQTYFPEVELIAPESC